MKELGEESERTGAERIADLKRRSEELEREVQDGRTELQRLKVEVTEKEEEVRITTEGKAELDRRIQELEGELEKGRTELDGQKEEMKKKEEEFTDFKAKAEEKFNKLKTQAKNKVKAMEEELQGLKKVCRSYLHDNTLVVVGEGQGILLREYLPCPQILRAQEIDAPALLINLWY